MGLVSQKDAFGSFGRPRETSRPSWVRASGGFPPGFCSSARVLILNGLHTAFRGKMVYQGLTPWGSGEGPRKNLEVPANSTQWTCSCSRNICGSKFVRASTWNCFLQTEPSPTWQWCPVVLLGHHTKGRFQLYSFVDRSCSLPKPETGLVSP